MAGKAGGYQYEYFTHQLHENNENKVYCRAMNEVVAFSKDRCEYCPLKRAEGCYYRDVVSEKNDVMTPEQSKECTDKLIEREAVQEFPEFVDGILWDERFKPYEKALQFAANAHKGARRKGSHLPYIIHPVEVSMIVMKLTDDVEVVVSATLHDVVEDTDYTIEDIHSRFGEKVATLVGAESEDKRRDKRPEDTWEIRKKEAIEHLKNASIEVKMITLADKLSNMRATKKDCVEYGDAVWEKFNQKDKELQAWYYISMFDNLKELADTEPWMELKGILEYVF